MNKQVFTPGPWSVGGKYVFKSVLLNAKGESIASGGNNRVIQGEVLEASLRLAAAAPELYEALSEAVKWADEMDTGDVIDGDPIASWRAALAKAVTP